jgi:Xaa-Pro aminopeptidase
MAELDIKLQRLAAVMDVHQVDAVHLRLASSFAWITGGKSSYINTASSTGLASVLITRTGRYALTTNIEAPRIAEEEGLAAAGWDVRAASWYAGDETLATLTAGLRVGSDLPAAGEVDLGGPVGRLRAALLPVEVDRFRALGHLCATAMDAAIRRVRPGMTEYEIAGLLSHETESRGAQAIVNLIATDERIFRFRHPLPTGKKMDKYAMLVLCGRREGLVCSVTRLVHFGPLSAELEQKQAACAVVDATILAATRPGARHNEILAKAQAAYAAEGFDGEWKLHHQGGPAGYEAREWLATPDTTDTVEVGHSYAWNPSITGTKVEDSILVGENSNEIVTAIPGWPTIDVTIDGVTYARPAILVI